MARYECDVLIVGGGITAAMVSQKLTELKPNLKIIVVEAGKRLFDFENRFDYRQRSLDYGENQWPGDFVADQGGTGSLGLVSRAMAVGGSALHFGGVCNRYSEEDTRLKSLYGLATDWAVDWRDLEKHYCEAERRMGVSGEPSPLKEDARSEPYPMPAMNMTYNLIQLKSWAEKSGIPFWTTPQCKNTVDGYGGRGVCRRCNTCEVCPTGARYSPDWTFKQLLDAKKIQLHDQTLIRKLVLDDKTTRIVAAQAAKEDGSDNNVEYRAQTFIIASGYCWSAHLLLLSANSRFPNGLANSSDHVGRYMTGHRAHETRIDLDVKIYPGMNEQHSLISRQFFRCAPDKPYVRHDLRVWEAASGRPRLRDANGKLMFGDEIISDWRTRIVRGTARVRGYFDTHPDKDSRLTLNPANKNKWGDPMPAIVHRTDAATQERSAATLQHFTDLFAQLAKANDGKVGRISTLNYQDHPAGGCRMGTDPATSVVDGYGRTHDHQNLFVVGSPTQPTGGCTNGTLTFVALALRSTAEIAKG
jgi:quinoprotein glucose dehydrogenase